MSILTSFIEEHLISVLESSLIAHEPELQAEFLAEMKVLSEKALSWIDSKIHKTA